MAVDDYLAVAGLLGLADPLLDAGACLVELADMAERVTALDHDPRAARVPGGHQRRRSVEVPLRSAHVDWLRLQRRPDVRLHGRLEQLGGQRRVRMSRRLERGGQVVGDQRRR